MKKATLTEFIPTVQMNLVPMTLIYPVTPDGQLVMGVKKKKFGVGKLLGYGGKLEPGESFLSCAKRELSEETGITPIKIEHRGTVCIYFLKPKEYTQHVQLEIFTCTKWDGELTETDEQSIEYFTKESLDFSRMIEDTKIFVPRLFDLSDCGWGYQFLYDEKYQIIDTKSY